MRQNSITVISPILKNKVTEVQRLLKAFKAQLNHGEQKEFENLNTIHFARWLVIDAQNPLQTPKLVFVSDFDGPREDLLKGLCSVSEALIDRIYENCADYPTPQERTPENRSAYLNRHSVKDTSVYIGAPGRSLQQIKEENKLRNHIKELLDAKSWKDTPPDKIHQEIKEKVLANVEFEWVKKNVELPGINWLAMILLGLVLVLLLPVIILWIVILHFFYERKDKNFTLKRSELNSHFLSNLESFEDFKHQNQFSQLVDMKTGKIRLITIKALFLFANTLIKYLFVKGKLMGIPTIHFARWVMFDDNKRVLFFSNFDGSWQQYLSDFIDKSGWGLTGIFSNTSVFPKTNYLLTGGAYDEEHFLAWSRHSEVPTNVWYSAYPQLSIKNVNNNSLIRVQLLKSLSKKQAEEFLKLI